ncbi:MAG: hypothetical protein GXP59_00545 [Deltaproteobacteria bacterium]|nr:hypothetical protein [Deltaproteobacteria bacterium]
MQQILSAQAGEGMVLAKDVMISEDRVLCGKGTVLTTALIDRLAKMDIMHITVEGHPVEISGEKSLKEELRDIESRFSQVTQVPPLMFIKKILRQKMMSSRGK